MTTYQCTRKLQFFEPDHLTVRVRTEVSLERREAGNASLILTSYDPEELAGFVVGELYEVKVEAKPLGRA